MKKIVISFLGIFAGGLLLAQNQGSFNRSESMNNGDGIISGKVIEANTKSPMEFTSIGLYEQKDSTLITGSITGPDGSFSLKEIPYGRFYLVANFMGYEKFFKEDITLTPRQKIIDLEVIELKQSVRKLDEVEIVADQAHVQYKIDRKVINVSQDINAATGTAADVLQNTPSVSVDIDGNVSLRGSGNFTVLIDGKPTPLSGSDALQQIPASAIRNIEIITNPSAKYDPDGMAGIINIISKKNSLNGLSGIINATIGTREKKSGDFLLNYRSGKFNVYAGASYTDNTYSGQMYALKQLGESPTLRFDEMSGTSDRARNGYELKGGFEYSLNDNNTLGLSLETGSHEFGSGGNMKQRIYDEQLSFDEYLLTDEHGTHGGDYITLNLNHTKKFAEEGHELVSFISLSQDDGGDRESQMQYTANSDFIRDESILPVSLRTSENGNEFELRAQVDYTRPLGENGKLETGYQARIDDEVESYLFENFDPDLNDWIGNDQFSSSTDFFRNIQAFYATYGNSIKNFQYQLGLRGEYTDRRILHGELEKPLTINRFDLFPTFHFSRSFKNNHQLMASYSRRINRPRGWYLEPFLTYMNSTTLRKGDPGLEPEYMNSYELGYQKSFGSSFIALETYYKNTVNKIERIQEIYDIDQGITLMTFDNISQDHSLGSELMINYANLKWLNINASTSIYRYRIEGEINGVEINTRSNNWDTRLNTTINFSTKTRLQLTGMYMGPSVTAQGKREAFFFSNIAVRHDFLDRKLSAILQVRDIFGSSKHEFTSNGPSFMSYVKFTGEAQVVMLSLSYKINNYKQRRSEGGQDSGMEMGEGDMF